ncbi:adhesion G-protein coupled receptor G7-like [Perca fluviatilis]|uniref:adhesion G-protein coupled receptor G7-like n=1 Tax=Perca fluviatilis TaxID=8168 RepID=UPI001965FEDD|nr:adhesion G-protein coupled receptor G7-like [Perca fluviatilis]
MFFRPKYWHGTQHGLDLDFSCVFWDYSLEDWSEAGCWKGKASNGLLECFCNHTGTFAALCVKKQVCYNGGLLNGVCICPDEWTGKNCSVENFCEAQNMSGLNFPRTPVSRYAYSKEICPPRTSAAGKPQASTRCSKGNISPSFQEPPRVLQCDLTLADIQQNLNGSADLETLAASAQILTSQPEDLTAEEVTMAAQIADTLLSSENVSQSVREAAVATVSQILNADPSDNNQENSAFHNLTLTLSRLSVNLSLISNDSKLVQPNIAIQSAQISAADTLGVQFTALSGTLGSFIADRIQLDTNTSALTVEPGFIADAVFYLQFPPGGAAGSLRTPSNVSVGFVLYQNDHFFRSQRYRRRRATVRVLSATVGGLEPQKVQMEFRPLLLDSTSLWDFSCVFWDYSLEDWSEAGCWKGNASDGVLRCFCNHTTNFAALWSFRENYEYADMLDVISIVGLSLSILGLVFTIIHHITDNFKKNSGERKKCRNSQLALLSICFSLLAFIITFLSGVTNRRQDTGEDDALLDTETNGVLDSDEHVAADSGPCSVVTALLHFFLLATFMWNSMYATQLVLLIRKMHQNLPPYWTKLSTTIGWGVPAVVMAITLGIAYRVDEPLGYRQEEFCWLAALDKSKHFDFGKPMFWGFLLPIGLILIYNIVLLVLVSQTTCRTDPALKSSSPRSVWRKFLISFSLAVLLGLSWTLGYLVLVTTGYAHLVLSILFCLCTTTQGLQIFVLFTARTPSFRAGVSQVVQSISSVNIQLKEFSYNLLREWTHSTESYRDLTD